MPSASEDNFSQSKTKTNKISMKNAEGEDRYFYPECITKAPLLKFRILK